MSDKELNHVESVFHAVLELAPDDREAYLQQACNGDKSLYAEVSSLISAFDSREGFIEEPALNLGLKVLTQSPEQSLVGVTIGPYQVISQLGKGGMGEVYLAEDTRLSRNVALKFISPEFVGDNWAKRQLIKEAQAAAMLDHPNICPVYGIEEFGERAFIVMQYVEGKTLAEIITGDAQESRGIAVPLARQILGALAEAHSHAIIHRDVKPRNIMVTPNGQVKVLDFGLAKTVQQHKASIDESISHLKQNGLLAGTVAYMSPEQLRGERLDFRTDIFSVGVVLYELIENKKLFSRNSEAESISAILTEEAPSLTKTNAQYPQLERVVRKCLEKDREKRYRSASEVLLALEEPLDNRNRRPLRLIHITLALSLFLALVIGAILLLSRKQSANPPVSNMSQSDLSRTIKIAVLPLDDPRSLADASLKDGLVESLIDKFSRLKGVHVSPYTAVAGYKSKSVDAKEAGRVLEVDAVLVGRIIRDKDNLSLESKLIKTADGSEMWAGEQQINWPTILELEERLAKNVSASLELQTEDERQLVAEHGTNSPEAFREYMAGRYHWRNRDLQKMNLAIRNFKTAIELDPVYAKAWAGLADCYVLQSTVAFGKTPTEDAMTRASAAAKEALAIDPNLAEAHTSLGVVNLRFDWDLNGAERELKKAIELDRDYAPAHYWYSHLLLISGRSSEAVAESALAKKLDPSSPPSSMKLLPNTSQCR
jgi:serine/threonine protein kinase